MQLNTTIMKKTLLTTIIYLSAFSSLFAQLTCNSATVISAGTYTLDAVNGTEVPDPVCASGGTGATAGKWYKYTAPADYTVTVTTDFAANTGIDNRVNIYIGNCGALACLAGDDDNGTGYLCITTFQVTQGTEYTIGFDNLWSSSGFVFELQEAPPIIINPNDVTFNPQNISTITGDYKIAVADMNGDLMDDIVSIASNYVQIHYQQSGGGFNPVNIATTPTSYMPSWSLAIADYNKDGYGDILYGSGNGVTFMKSNNAGADFTQVTSSQYVFSQRSNFTDLNNDGNLDAFVCHDVAPNVYYMNDGAGNLQFNQGGIGDHPNGGNYGSIWVDYNNDGFSDLFIAKCRGGYNTAKINELHRNNGDGTFTNVSAVSNMADSVQTWSSAWNDFDNDGYLDAVIGASSFTDGNHKFMHNNGDGTFTDITAGSGWDAFPHLSIEYVSYDFNNDGWADVFTNGQIMFNNGDNTFTSTSFPMSVGAVGDLNNDGFLDVQNGNTVYYSNTNSNNWTKLQLKGIQSNSNGIGARVEIYGSWGRQIRDVQSGIGFRHMGTMNVHFGIGAAVAIDSVIVKWPSGRIDLICNPAINTPLILTEGMVEFPIAGFAASATTVPEGTTVNFNDESTICPSAWSWSVNPITGWVYANSSTNISQNPEITFNNAGTYIVELIAYNTNGQSTVTATESIIVTSTAGLNNLTNELIRMYPNPTEQILNIEVLESTIIKHIEIVSMMGVSVQTKETDLNYIDVSSIETGTYLIILTTENGSKLTSRFIKK